MRTTLRTRRAGLVPIILLLVMGCASRSLPPRAEPDEARAALRTALDSWQSGGAPDALQRSSPHIQMADDDWLAGRHLVRYELEGNERLAGTGLRCGAVLTLKGQDGKAAQRRVAYQIDMHPRIVIVRADGP